ncbi:SGNH/GDSL hydrolase family protein [Shimia sp. SDUM112013]|uniref:SGNH/GDSL hydrolase family protein n=1 Tax=Shimia sp. SDUM112013 TaxID=3136160 RepID=UPI0032ECAD39
MKFSAFFLSIVLLFGTTAQAEGNARILAIGDSLMAWHGISARSIAHNVARELEEPVLNNSVSGARIVYKLPLTGAFGMRIGNQLTRGDWDWVIMNGGGNDLWLGCGCVSCDKRMRKMISPDGRRGEIPRLVDTARKAGSKVVYIGYLRSPGVGSMIDACRDDGDALEARISKLAEILPDVYFVSLADLVPYGDRSFHGVDMIHPSLKASREIGKRVADVIRENDPTRN